MKILIDAHYIGSRAGGNETPHAQPPRRPPPREWDLAQRVSRPIGSVQQCFELIRRRIKVELSCAELLITPLANDDASAREADPACAAYCRKVSRDRALVAREATRHNAKEAAEITVSASTTVSARYGRPYSDAPGALRRRARPPRDHQRAGWDHGSCRGSRPTGPHSDATECVAGRGLFLCRDVAWLRVRRLRNRCVLAAYREVARITVRFARILPPMRQSTYAASFIPTDRWWTRAARVSNMHRFATPIAWPTRASHSPSAAVAMRMTTPSPKQWSASSKLK